MADERIGHYPRPDPKDHIKGNLNILANVSPSYLFHIHHRIASRLGFLREPTIPTILYHTILYFSVLYCIILCYTILYLYSPLPSLPTDYRNRTELYATSRSHESTAQSFQKSLIKEYRLKVI